MSFVYDLRELLICESFNRSRIKNSVVQH